MAGPTLIAQFQAQNARRQAKALAQDLRDLGQSGHKAEKGVSDLDGSAASLGTRMGTLAGQVGKVGVALAAAAAAAGVFAVGRLVSDSIAAAAGFESLRVQLETFEGSAEAAASRMEQLAEFTAATPFQLEKATQAWVRYASTGLQPTMRDLEAAGNLAAGTGKDISEATNAIVSAAFGEAESLKQFGIIMKQEGDKAKITFNGMTQEVNRDAASIKEALVGIAETNFAGAMERQSKTMEGLLSTLRDEWKLLLALIGDEFLPAVKPALEGLIAYLKAIRENFDIVKMVAAEFFKGAQLGFDRVAKQAQAFARAMERSAALLQPLGRAAEDWRSIADGIQGARIELEGFADELREVSRDDALDLSGVTAPEIKKVAGALSGDSGSVAAGMNEIQQRMGTAVGQVVDTARSLAVELQDVVNEASELAAFAAEFQAWFPKVKDKTTETANETVEWGEAMREVSFLVGSIDSDLGQMLGTVVRIVEEFQNLNDEIDEASSSGSGGGGGWGALGTALGIAGLFKGLYDMFSASNDRRSGRQFGTPATIDGAGGFYSAFGNYPDAERRDMVNQMTTFMNDILDSIGGTVDELGTISINATKNGEQFEATLGATVLGVFSSFDEAMGAAAIAAITEATFTGLGEHVAQVLADLDLGTDIDEFKRQLELAVSIDELQIEPFRRAMHRAFDELLDLARQWEALGKDASAVYREMDRTAQSWMNDILGIQVPLFDRLTAEAAAFNAEMERLGLAFRITGEDIAGAVTRQSGVPGTEYQDSRRQFIADLQDLAAPLDAVGQLTRQYQADLADLAERQRRFNVSSEEYEAGIAGLNAEFERGLQSIGRGIAGGLSPIASMLFGVEDVAAAVDQLRQNADAFGFSAGQVDAIIRDMSENRFLSLAQGLANFIGDQELSLELQVMSGRLQVAQMVFEAERWHQLGLLSDEYYNRLMDLAGRANEALDALGNTVSGIMVSALNGSDKAKPLTDLIDALTGEKGEKAPLLDFVSGDRIQEDQLDELVRIREIQEDLIRFQESLLTDSALSPLSNKEQFGAAQDALQKAIDEGRLEDLPALVRSLLGSGVDLFGIGSAEYRDLFDEMYKLLGEQASRDPFEVLADRFDVAAGSIETAVSGISTAIASVATEVAGVAGATLELAPIKERIGGLKASIDPLTGEITVFAGEVKGLPGGLKDALGPLKDSIGGIKPIFIGPDGVAPKIASVGTAIDGVGGAVLSASTEIGRVASAVEGNTIAIMALTGKEERQPATPRGSLRRAG